MKRLICRVLGHSKGPLFTQPDQRFEKVWNKWLEEPIWMEVFDWTCQRCGTSMRSWSWTRPAARKMLEDE